MYHLHLNILEISQDNCGVTLRESDVLAEVTFFIENDINRRRLEILRVKSDPMCLVNWLFENKSHILCDNFPLPNIIGSSIAEKISGFYEVVDSKNVDLLQIMYEYRTQHGLRFALRGFDINDIYLGRTEIGHEISCASGSINWSYSIDLETFFSEVESVKPVE